MSVVKTAISLQEDLFQQMEQLAGDLHLSRSSLVALTVQECIARHENKRLLEQLFDFQRPSVELPTKPGRRTIPLFFARIAICRL